MMSGSLANNSRANGWLPVGGAPVGLVTWYAPAGPAVAALTSWLAVVNGCPPELRAGCSGRLPVGERLPEGTDFVVNIPGELRVPVLERLTQQAGPGGFLTLEEDVDLLPARMVHAPLLGNCALQIECSHGWIVPGDWDMELVGGIVLLHRAGVIVAPADHHDFCALRPLHTQVFS